MSRTIAIAVAAVAMSTAAGCSKSAGNQDVPPPATADRGTAPTSNPIAPPDQPPSAPTKIDDRLRLHDNEGTLAITPPADAKAGAEATATILVTPKPGFHVNTEFPIKLKLEQPSGITLAKTELTAGGSSKAVGDADALDEQHLALSVKVTAAQAGTYTINGSFKFAVCDHDSCLAKKEPIAITVAAK